jgi:PAS domain S-box-containing protein
MSSHNARAAGDPGTRAHRQAVVADLGLQAASEVDLQALLDETVGLVSRTLAVEYCEIVEPLPEGDGLLLRAGFGWKEGLVGKATERMENGTRGGFVLASDEPVIVEDLCEEARFDRPPMLAEHGVISGVTVAIPGGDRRFGVLGAHTTRRRAFTEEDVDFLRAVANLLAAAIARLQAGEHDRFQSLLLQQLPAAVIATDPRGTVTHWNDHAERMYGYSREEALGRSLAEVAVDPTEHRITDDATRQSGIGEAWEGELVARRKDGSMFPAYVIDSPIQDAEGRVVGTVRVSTDFTERKLAEEALIDVRETERRRIARDLHDMVLQDLASVVQSLQAARMRSGPAESDDSLQLAIDTLRDATRNLRTTVMDLRLQSETSLVRGVESLVGFARESEPECEVRLDVQPGFPEELGRTDVELLHVVREALVNVRHHSGAAHVTVSLWVEDGGVRAEVTDDGRGFDSGRVSDGVGLSVMRERIASLGGRLEVRSRVGKGTTVRATVPFP